MHPLAVGAEPDVLAGLDDRTAAGADLARGVQFVVAEVGAGLVILRHRVFLLRAAEIFQQPSVGNMSPLAWNPVG